MERFRFWSWVWLAWAVVGLIINDTAVVNTGIIASAVWNVGGVLNSKLDTIIGNGKHGSQSL